MVGHRERCRASMVRESLNSERDWRGLMTAANAGEGLGRAALAKKASGMLIGISVAFILQGLAAIIEPEVAGLAVTILVGWLFIIGGVVHVVAAFGAHGADRTLWQILIAFAYLVGGIYLLMHPLMGLGTLTLLLAGIILMVAVIEVIVYFRYFRARGQGGASWLLMNAIIT